MTRESKEGSCNSCTVSRYLDRVLRLDLVSIALLVVAPRLLVNETTSLHCSGHKGVNFCLDSVLFCSTNLTLGLVGEQVADPPTVF